MIISDGPMEVVAIPNPPTSFETGLPNPIRFEHGLAPNVPPSPLNPSTYRLTIRILDDIVN